MNQLLEGSLPSIISHNTICSVPAHFLHHYMYYYWVVKID